MAHITITEWVQMMREEVDKAKKRQEQLLFDIASFVLKRAKYHARVNFGRGPGKTARTKGRSGALMRSIEMVRVDPKTFQINAGGPGVPYAAIHELGTKGKGGQLPDIVPKNAGALTIPLLGQYVGRRAREFDLVIAKKKGSKFSFLKENRKGGKYAYLLLFQVSIPARPYIQPAINDLTNEVELTNRIRVLFGTSKFPYEINKI